MIAAQKIGDDVFFRGSGIDVVRFACCVRKHAGFDAVRSRGPGVISISENVIPAIVNCLDEFGVDKFPFADFFQSVAKHEQARRDVLQIMADNNGSGLPEPWSSRLQDHQKIAVKAMVVDGLKGLCLFDEQGTGKTLMSLAAFDIMKEAGTVDFMMAIAPKSVLNAWRDDTQKFLGDKYSFASVTGERAKKVSTMREMTDILAFNYETAASLLTWVLSGIRGRKAMLVVDESFFIKNPNAARSDAVQKIRRACVRGFVLSGTPAPNSPEDIIHQADIADDGHTFRGCEITGDRIRDAEIVHNALCNRGVYLRRLKSAVAPWLPPKHFEIVKVHIVGRQGVLYSEARDNLVLELRDMNNEFFQRNKPNYLAKRAQLLKICSCPATVDSLYSGDHAKLPVLDDILRRVIDEEGKKIVLWTTYKQSVLELRDRYRQYGVAVIHGETPDIERERAIKNFQENSDTRVFLGNLAAASAGITLHAASDAVYVSYSDQAADFQQSLDRVHRIGQSAEIVRYYLLVCEGTIEVNQIRLLQEKDLRQRSLFGEGGEWPQSVEDALSELEDE